MQRNEQAASPSHNDKSKLLAIETLSLNDNRFIDIEADDCLVPGITTGIAQH